jgi:hypothetical protein
MTQLVFIHGPGAGGVLRRFATSSSIFPEVWPRPYPGILPGLHV